MADDDDLASVLPQPPLPAPARREAAIGEAMRRFDGLPPTPVEGRSAVPSASWWSRLNRPYAGAMVGAALVALVALPLAWTSVIEQAPIDRTGSPVNRAHEPPPSDLAIVTADAGQPPAALAPPAVTQNSPAAADDAVTITDAPPTLMAQKIEEASASPVAAASPAPPPAAPPPPPAQQSFGRLAERDEAAARGQTQAAPSSRSGDIVQARRRMEAVRATPAEAERDDNIVVTSARRPSAESRRGDWNACTVDDPGRSLRNCRHLVDPAAKGATGRAAARIADGLARAWDGDENEAIAAFGQAIEIAPRSSFAYLNRGLAYRRNGDLDHALADLNRAVRDAPRSARAYYNRSLVLRQRGDIRRARADEQRAVDLDPRYADLMR